MTSTESLAYFAARSRRDPQGRPFDPQRIGLPRRPGSALGHAAFGTYGSTTFFEELESRLLLSTTADAPPSAGTPAATVMNAVASVQAPVVLTATPAALVAGSTTTIAITGQGTHWQQGASTVAICACTTVTSVTVLSATTLQFTAQVVAGATPGPRDVTVTTLVNGVTETAIGAAIMTMNAAPAAPAIMAVLPPALNPGTTTSLVLQGVGTAWDATSTVDLGAGVTVVSANVVSTTEIDLQVQTAANAASGFRTVTVTTGSQAVSLADGALVNGADVLQISPVVPAIGPLGESQAVTLTGNGTHFSAGITTVDFGAGITVTAVHVVDATHLVAQVNIDAGATLGYRNVAVTTGTELAAALQALLIIPARNTTTIYFYGSANVLADSSTPLTLTAKLYPTAGYVAATGTMNFYDGGTLLGSAPLDATAVATFTTTLVLGDRWLTAVYSGDPNYLPSTAPVFVAYVGTSHQRYVVQLYNDLFHRYPDPGGLQGWTAVLDGGASYQSVAMSITSSREYDGDIVDAFYVEYLGRHAEAGGLTDWVNLMQGGYNAEQIRAGILGSPEYFQDTGGTNTSFVTALYQSFLSRAPDPGGLADWVNLLNTQQDTTAQVATGFLNSDENRTDIITGFYATYMHRAPDPGGLAAWKAELAAGISQPAIISVFLSVPEYMAEYHIT